MDQLIPVVNKLQDVFNILGYDPIDLPQIVVVGSQSSGKSSVLESLVRRDFLPRGTDIVTRRPLVLQMLNENYHDAMDIASAEEWAEFLHLPGKILTDFNQVRREIEKETERIAGSNKGISNVPIHLKIHSTKCVNLTLVDLPGITKIPVGDQPADIENQIREMIYEYVRKRNSIILAVSPANVDLVNSDALKFAREVDPEGIRTIGVLTKLDLMDAGTHAMDILNNSGPYRLKLGFIGIVNRSQQDILRDRKVEDALLGEVHFFKNHPHYRSIAHRCGSVFLADTLNKVLIHHIRDRIPELRSKLNTLIISTQQELLSYGDPSFQGKAHRGTLLLRLLTKFSNDFCDAIDGTSKNISTSELCGGARINYIFNDIYSIALNQIDACGGLTTQDIRTVIRNSTGPRSSLFVPEVSFELLVKRQIAKLEVPGMRCMELVFDELLKIIGHCERKELLRFPNLYEKIVETSAEMIRERLSCTCKMIENLVQIELAYINTSHPDFMGASAAISVLGKLQEKKRREQQQEKARKAAQQAEKDDENVDPKQIPSAIHSLNASNKKEPNGSGDHHYSNQSASQNGSSGGATKTGANQKSESGFLHYLFGVQNAEYQHNVNSAVSNPINRRENSSNHSTNNNTNTANNRRLSSPVRAMAPRKSQDNNNNNNNNNNFSNPFPNKLYYDDDLMSMSLSRLDLDSPPMTIEDSGAMSEKEELETQLIKSLIDSYFNVVRKNLQDSIPKSIMHFLVNHVKEGLQNRLVTELYREDHFSDLLKEDENVEKDRNKCKSMLDVFRKASGILNEIRDASIL